MGGGEIKEISDHIPCIHCLQATKKNIKWNYNVRNRMSKTQRAVNTDKEDTPFHDRRELYSHANTTVAGKKCVILRYTDRSCEVDPLSYKYTPMKDVPIVSAATGYMSENGRNYILVFNEALYIKEM